MIRPATHEDIPIAAGWWAERNPGERLAVEALPAIGCVSEDEHGPAGMAWVYLDNSKGVGFIEHLVMRPGLTVQQAQTAGLEVVAGLEAAAAALDYSVLVANALPACARTLKSCGYIQADPRPKVTMIKVLPKWHLPAQH